MITQSCQRNEDLGCCFRAITQHGLRVIWEVNSECNLCCRHCFATPAGTGGLDGGTMKVVIASMSENGVRKIAFTGGEPFLRPDLVEIVAYTRGVGIVPKILTNGMLITDEVIRSLSQIDALEVSVSLDGAGDRTHDSVRGKRGAFAATVENVRKLRTVPTLLVHATCVVSRLNYLEVEALVGLAADLGLRSINFSNVLTVNTLSLPRLDLYSHRYALDEAEQAAVRQAVERARRRFPGMAVRTLGFEQAIRPDECDAGTRVIFIDADGYVHPCSIARFSRPSSLREHSFPEILQSPALTALRQKDHALCRPRGGCVGSV